MDNHVTSITDKQLLIFELLPGKLLDLQIEAAPDARLKLPLIGYAYGQYIILKYPVGTRAGDYTNDLVEGSFVYIRFIPDGETEACFSFRSKIRHLIEVPEKCIVVDYPVRIDSRQLRKHQRTFTNIPATLAMQNDAILEDGKTQGIITDISQFGCGFTFKSENLRGELSHQHVNIVVNSPIEGELSLPAKICNYRYNQGKTSVGLAFEGNAEQVERLLVHLFIECL